MRTEVRAPGSPLGPAIDASTRLCAVYGFPVHHSASPPMQNAGFAALGLNWRYLAFAVPPHHLRSALEGACAMRFAGVNLTVPHKLLALDMMDVLDDSARTWGAVNTVRFEGRNAGDPWQPLATLTAPPAEVRMQGFNTDAEAITTAVREDLHLELTGAKVLLLGAGGAGRTAALKLASDQVGALYLVNRTAARAEAIADEIRLRFPGVSVHTGYPASNVDLVVNATSLGLRQDDASPCDEVLFPLRRAGAVFDMIYRPSETALLRHARAAGCGTANGLGMLLYQGARAFELWTGRPAPLDAMRRALTDALTGH